MMLAFVLLAALGCLVAQFIVSRKFGARALAAITALLLAALYYLWLRTLADFPADPCEVCRLAGQ